MRIEPLAAGGAAAPATAGADDTLPARPVVLFGLCEVLVRGDPMRAFLRSRCRTASWRWVILLPCLPWLVLQALVSRTAARATLGRLALLGVHEARFQRLVDDFAARLVRRSRSCCRDGLRAMRQCTLAGDRVVVASACEQRLVEALFRELGLGSLVEVLAADWRDGWSGMRQVQANGGARKARRLARLGLGAGTVAYAARLSDVPMLRLAKQAVLVNATPAQQRKLEQSLGRSVTRVAWY